MSVHSKNIAVICNPTTNNAKALQVADTIANILKAKAIRFSLFTVYWPDVWNAFTEAWIVGGDGTVNYFINQYPHLKIPLCVFAGGSGNDLHWMLYGDSTIEAQIEKVIRAQPQAIDAGICNGRLFLNGVGIGFDGAVVEDLQGKQKRSGKSSYYFSILKNIFRYTEKRCAILLDERVATNKITEDCFMLSIANGKRFGGGFNVAPKASLTDGLLEVIIIGTVPKLKRLQYLPVIERGEHLSLPFINYHQAKKTVIASSSLLPAHIDGDFFRADYFRIACLPEHFSFLR